LYSFSVQSIATKYYIHLQPEDYKTGDIYLEWLGEFPNTEFPDGTRFYDYLNRWLFQGYQDANGEWHGMRELVASSGVKTVFARGIMGDPHNTTTMSGKVRKIFTRWTGVPITPHDLRHLYRTYIDDPATGASAEEKESAAYWMRHSSQMAAKTYSHLNNEQKLRAGAQLSARINQSLLR
jgi:integrase